MPGQKQHESPSNLVPNPCKDLVAQKRPIILQGPTSRAPGTPQLDEARVCGMPLRPDHTHGPRNANRPGPLTGVPAFRRIQLPKLGTDFLKWPILCVCVCVCGREHKACIVCILTCVQTKKETPWLPLRVRFCFASFCTPAARYFGLHASGAGAWPGGPAPRKSPKLNLAPKLGCLWVCGYSRELPGDLKTTEKSRRENKEG